MATERIKLFEADIDVDGIIKKSSELKNEFENLKERQKELKASGDTVSETYVKLEARLKNVSREYGINQKQLSNLTSASGGTVSITQKLDAALAKEVVTVSAAAKNNAELKKIRNEVNATTVEGQKAIAEINKKLDENTNFIKANVSELENQKIGIGDYKTQIKEAFNEMNIFNGGFTGFLSRAQEAGGVLPLVGKGIKGVTSGIFGMVKASVAFLATPIGLVLAAIGLVLGTVINYLKSTQAGIDAVTAVTRPLSAVFESLIGILQQVGEFLFKAFANPKKTITDVYNFVKDKVIKVFTGYFDILAGIATLDFDRAKKGLSDINDVAIEGINSIKNAAGAIGDTFAEAIKRGQKIDEIQKKLSKGEADFIDQQSRLKEELKEQNLIAEDQTRSLAEREAAASRSIQISKDINGLQKERIELERQLLVLNSQNNDTSDAQKAEIAQKLAEIRESNAQQLELETTQQNKLNSIRKEGAEKAATQRQKSLDEAAEKMKLELDLYLQNQDEKGKSLEQELQGLEILRDKSLAIAKAEFNATKKTENDKLAYLKSQNDIKKKFLEETSQAVEDYARAELELWKASHLSKIDSDKALTREIIDEENKRLDYIRENSLKILEGELETNQAIIDQKRAHNEALSVVDLEYLTQKAEIDNEYNQQILTNEKSLKDAAKAREIEELETANQIKLAEAQTKYEEDIANEQILHDAEVAKLKARKEAGLITEAQFNLLSEAETRRHKQVVDDINFAMFMNKVQLASNAFGNLATILGKETKAGKAAAIAQATIDTLASAVSAYKSMSVIPAVGPILGALAAGAALAAGYANVKKIVSTKEPTIPKAERGAVFNIGGKRHSQGGTKFYGEDGSAFEAEKDEKMFILNRQASAALGPLLSDINQQYGGVSLSRSSAYLAAGGQVLRGASQKIDQLAASQMLKDAVREGSVEGTMRGSMEGSLQGSRQGSMEGSSKGTYSGIVDKETNETIAAGANF